MKEDVPANSMGASPAVPGTGGSDNIQMFTPKLKIAKRQKRSRDEKRRQPSTKVARRILAMKNR